MVPCTGGGVEPELPLPGVLLPPPPPQAASKDRVSATAATLAYQAHRQRGEHRAEQQAERRIEHARGDRHAERVVEEREARGSASCWSRRPARSRAHAAMPRRSPLTSVTWALDIATSVPVPMAMPTSAAASAGASLMPSPAIATRRPSACSRATSSALSCGRTSPCTSSMPSCRATASRGRPAVARGHHDAQPGACSASIASAARVLDRIGHGDQADARAVEPRGTSRVAPSSAQPLGRVGQRHRRRHPTSCMSAALPSASDATVDAPAHAEAGHRLEVRRRRQRAGRVAAPRRRSHRRAGARCPGRGWRRAAALRRPARRRCPITSRNAGRPCVSVPVLSTISVSIVRSRSIASASRNRTPACAARPVATMIDIGVARPSAQGQAMISTATALTTA